MNFEESQAVTSEINTLLEKGVIIPSSIEPGDVLSNVFTRPKKVGYRMILNLKNVNSYVEYKKFKMDTLWTAIKLMTPNCYMASIDLSDAYYTVPVSIHDQKYVKFMWEGKVFQYVCLPNGLASGPRKFNKLLKPIYATVRNMGHSAIGYFDDSWLTASSFVDCTHAVTDLNALFQKTGFIINQDKSVFVPTQIIVFLGMVLNSILMMVFLTDEKANKIQNLCESALFQTHMTIRHLARIIGKIVSCFPAAEYGPLHYRGLERLKIAALRENFGDYDALCVLNDEARSDLTWWSENVHSVSNRIQKGTPEISVQTDSSDYAWGAFCNNSSTGGRFSIAEVDFSINTKELLAIKYGIMSFRDQLANKHILVQSDNMTAVSYVRKMGGTKHGLRNRIAQDLWDFCIRSNIWITITHIPGVQNLEADRASRILLTERTEWSLERNVFDKIVALFGDVQVDLFASRLNFKVQKYVSWLPDPQCFHVDALTLTWQGDSYYAFPPFSLIHRCINKIQADGTDKILMILPLWPTQAWWPAMLTLLVDYPRTLKGQPIHLPWAPEAIHPLTHLKLIVVHLSGNVSKTRDFQKRLSKSYSHHGEILPRNNMQCTSRSGTSFVVNGRIGQILPL